MFMSCGQQLPPLVVRVRSDGLQEMLFVVRLAGRALLNAIGVLLFDRGFVGFCSKEITLPRSNLPLRYTH